jgi:hypothetical protein
LLARNRRGAFLFAFGRLARLIFDDAIKKRRGRITRTSLGHVPGGLVNLAHGDGPLQLAIFALVGHGRFRESVNDGVF